MNVDKTFVASIALHVLVLGWGLVTFSSKAYIAPEESLPIDIISTDQRAQMMSGKKTGKKEEPKPKVEKSAEAKPEEDAVGKVTEKKELIKTNSTPEPPPKPVEKPVEKKPDPTPPAAQAYDGYDHPPRPAGRVYVPRPPAYPERHYAPERYYARERYSAQEYDYEYAPRPPLPVPYRARARCVDDYGRSAYCD